MAEQGSTTTQATTESTEQVVQAAESQAVAGATGTPTSEGANQEPETFPREYVEELRRENARRRKDTETYEQAFQGYAPEERDALLDIAKGLADPNTSVTTAKRLQAIADNIIKGHEGGQPTRPTGEEDPDQKPMTRAEFKAEQQRIQQEQQESAALESIQNECRALGVEPGTLEYAEVLFLAQDPEVNGDLAKANEKRLAHYREQSSKIAQEVEQSAGRWPGTSGTANNTGAADSEPVEPTWSSARKAATAFLKARAGQTS